MELDENGRTSKETATKTKQITEDEQKVIAGNQWNSMNMREDQKNQRTSKKINEDAITRR